MENESRPQSLISAFDQETQHSCGVAYEYRKSERIPYQSVVELTFSSGPAKAATRNISLGGLFVDTKIQPCLGQLIELNFQFRFGRQRMKLQAQVVRKTSEGLGLKLL